MSVLTPRHRDFSRWYQELFAKAELAENGPVRGTMVIRPYGYAIWELLQAAIDARIKGAGAENAYFPLFIPQSYLQKESEHVKGFSPELAVVTHGGGKELEEPVVVRPTSETVIGEYMAKWIQSYRDLPMLLNQWANVVRWELRPRLFLRTSEFLWQEGHTAHATEAEAAAYARKIHLEVYRDVMREVMGIPTIVGIKTVQERFAGASATLTCEGMMGDGKALQLATSHELGQNFSRAFDMNFLDHDGERRLAWTTSWGSSTRMLGGLFMVHGDDAGLRLPPRLSPIQVVVLPVRDDSVLTEKAAAIVESLRAGGVRCRLDMRDGLSFGRRTTDWEVKGVPLRIEVGPRDLAQDSVTIARRDLNTKEVVPLASLPETVRSRLDEAQACLFDLASSFLNDRTRDVDDLTEAIEATSIGFARLPWKNVGIEGERTLLGRKLTVRCLTRRDGSLPDSADEPDLWCVVGRSY